MASLDGVFSCGGATNHMNGQSGAGVTLCCAIPMRNTPHAFEGPYDGGAPAHLLVGRVVDDRLGAGKQVDVLALDELGAALRRLPAML